MLRVHKIGVTNLVNLAQQLLSDFEASERQKAQRKQCELFLRTFDAEYFTVGAISRELLQVLASRKAHTFACLSRFRNLPTQPVMLNG